MSREQFPYQDHKSPASQLAIVILTLPIGSRRLRLLSLFVNSLLFLASIEFAAEDYLRDAPDTVFTRLGAIYPDRVKLAIRYPHHKDPIHVLWRKARESSDLQAQPWTLGPPIIFSEVGDWVNSTTISPLWPNTMYECNLLTLFSLTVCFLLLTFDQICWGPQINNSYPTHRFPFGSKPFPIPSCPIPPRSASSYLPA
jgi:hypothetical protein